MLCKLKDRRLTVDCCHGIIRSKPNVKETKPTNNKRPSPVMAVNHIFICAIPVFLAILGRKKRSTDPIIPNTHNTIPVRCEFHPKYAFVSSVFTVSNTATDPRVTNINPENNNISKIVSNQNLKSKLSIHHSSIFTLCFVSQNYDIEDTVKMGIVRKLLNFMRHIM